MPTRPCDAEVKLPHPRRRRRGRGIFPLGSHIHLRVCPRAPWLPLERNYMSTCKMIRFYILKGRICTRHVYIRQGAWTALLGKCFKTSLHGGGVWIRWPQGFFQFISLWLQFPGSQMMAEGAQSWGQKGWPPTSSQNMLARGVSVTPHPSVVSKCGSALSDSNTVTASPPASSTLNVKGAQRIYSLMIFFFCFL